MTLDVTSASARGFTCTLRSSDGRYLPGAAGFPSGGVGSPTATGLIWYGTRFRPWMDLRVGTDAQLQPIYDRTYLGIFVLVSPEMQVTVSGGVVALTLLDKSALLQKPFRITASALPTYTTGGHSAGGYAAGSTFDSVMTDLATRAGVPAGKLNFTPSTLTLPQDYPITEGSEWWTHLTALAASMSHVLYFDALGTLVRRPDPTSLATPSAYTFSADPSTGVIITANRKTDLASTYNHVIVLGASSSGDLYRGEATVQDASSPYHSNQIGDRVVYVGQNGFDDLTPDPTIGSSGQATTKAQVTLAQTLGQMETFDLTARNNPAFEAYDRITVNLDQAGSQLDAILRRATWNLDNTGMTLEATRWFAAGS